MKKIPTMSLPKSKALVRRLVQDAFADYHRAEAALEVAKDALKQAHAIHVKVTGFHFGEQEFLAAFRKRVGPAECKRLDTLHACHELAAKLLKEQPAIGLREAQRRAWKQMGANADGTLRKKVKK